MVLDPVELAYLWHHPPGRRLLAYPSGKGIDDRWHELQTHAVKAVYSFGPKQVQGFRILGLGYCGLVLLVSQGTQHLTLKIRRTDAPQPNFQAEGTALRLANGIGVGPQIRSSSDNFLLMDYVDGPRLVDWLQLSELDDLRPILRNLINQAHRLDSLGLDHGDLRCITDHALVTPQGPVLIDFGGASQRRRPANVTTLIQGLFIGTYLTTLIAPHFPHVEKASLINHLRRYKKRPTEVSFKALCRYLRL